MTTVRTLRRRLLDATGVLLGNEVPDAHLNRLGEECAFYVTSPDGLVRTMGYRVVQPGGHLSVGVRFGSWDPDRFFDEGARAAGWAIARHEPALDWDLVREVWLADPTLSGGIPTWRRLGWAWGARNEMVCRGAAAEDRAVALLPGWAVRRWQRWLEPRPGRILRAASR